MRFLDPMAGADEVVSVSGGRADAETVAPLKADFYGTDRSAAMGGRPSARRAGLGAGRRRRSRASPTRARGEARGSVREVGPHALTARVPPLSLCPHSHTCARASASLSCSTRALLTSLALREMAPLNPSSTPQPRAPPADLASDVAGGSSDVGLHPSYGG